MSFVLSNAPSAFLLTQGEPFRVVTESFPDLLARCTALGFELWARAINLCPLEFRGNASGGLGLGRGKSLPLSIGSPFSGGGVSVDALLGRAKLCPVLGRSYCFEKTLPGFRWQVNVATLTASAEISERPKWAAQEKVDQVSFDTKCLAIGQILYQFCFWHLPESGHDIADGPSFVTIIFSAVSFVPSNTIAAAFTDVKRRLTVLAKEGVDVEVTARYGNVSHREFPKTQVIRKLARVSSTVSFRHLSASAALAQG